MDGVSVTALPSMEFALMWKRLTQCGQFWVSNRNPAQSSL